MALNILERSMYWVPSVSKKKNLFIFKENLDGKLYSHIIQHNLLGQAYESQGYKWVLLHDKDPKHTSNVVSKLLDELRLKKLDWPSISPDLKPIENIWAVLKRNVAIKNPKNIEELEQAIREFRK